MESLRLSPKGREIIQAKFHLDGLDLDEEKTRQAVLAESSSSTVFEYGRIVIVVTPEGMVHLYRDGGDESLIAAGQKFMKDVWEKTSFTKLHAPIRQDRVRTLARFFGWKKVKDLPHGFEMYEVVR